MFTRVDDANDLMVDAADAQRMLGRRAFGPHQGLQRPTLFRYMGRMGQLGRRPVHHQRIVAHGLGRMRSRMFPDLLRRATADQFAARFAAFGAQVDQPIGRADHVEVMFDHDQRMPDREQLAQRPHQLGDVVEMQTGGRLIEHEQRALLGQRLARLGCRFGQETRQLEPLRFPARQGRHRLTQLYIFKPDVDDRLQLGQHLAVVLEQPHRFADGQIQRIGNAEFAVGPTQFYIEDLGTETPAVAIRASQIDIGQELHLDMLETRTATARAAPVTRIEAEHAGRIAALGRQRRCGKQLAQLVECADIAGRVRTRGLADRRLVNENRIGQPIGAEQAFMNAWRLGGAAEMPCQRRIEQVLHQGALARARHTGHHHQALQRKLDRQVFQVMFGRAGQDQPRIARFDRPLQAHADMLAGAHIGTGQGIGRANRIRRTVKNDLSATLAWAGAHVDQPVGRQHHRRVMLDHDQRIAGVAQALHRLDDAVHVARMQADARLVEHKQGVDQRRAKRRCQVDPLHLAAAERAALPIQRQIADADIAEVFQPLADLVEQQLQGIVEQAARQL